MVSSPAERAKFELSIFDQDVIDHNPWIFEIILMIIKIRRGESIEASFVKLHSILMDKVDDLDQLGSRWISSVLDTYIDAGDEQEQYEAMILNSYCLQSRMVHLAFKTFGGERRNLERSIANDKLNNNLKRLTKIIKLPLFKALMSIVIRIEVSDHYAVGRLVTRSPRYHQIIEQLNNG